MHVWSSIRDGGSDCLASHANDLDPIIGVELLPDRSVSQVGLSVHKACSRVCELGRDAQDYPGILAGAVAHIGYGRERADQDERREHGTITFIASSPAGGGLVSSTDLSRQEANRRPLISACQAMAPSFDNPKPLTVGLGRMGPGRARHVH